MSPGDKQARATSHAATFDVSRVRADFPALALLVNGRPLVYLDNASTTQKPRAVLEALLAAYESSCGNIHRGVHTLSQRATEQYEAVREKVRRFLGAPAAREIVFTRGTTEAVNLLAQTLGPARVAAGDEVVVSGLEHHSNFVPWQMLCAARGARLLVLPLDENGELALAEVDRHLSPRTRIVALSHASNALGSVLPVAEVSRRVRALAPGAVVVVDGAQAVPHLPIDVTELGCDFYCFSGHKLFAPTGVGVLWGRGELLDALPPWQGGGDMVQSVALDRSTYREVPHKFEAGTPPIAEVIGLGAAIDYLESVGLAAIEAHETPLREYGAAMLARIDGVKLLGDHSGAVPRVPVLSFVLPGIHPHDVGTALDCEGIAVRAGHHCAQPLMRHLGVGSTVRASLALYNTTAELDALGAALQQVVRMFR